MNLKKLVCLAAVAFACCGAGMNVSAMENEVCTDAAVNKDVFAGFIFDVAQQGSAEEDSEKNSLVIIYSPKYLDKICNEISDADSVRFKFIDPKGHELERIENKQFATINKEAEKLPIFGKKWDRREDLCFLSIPSMKELKSRMLLSNSALDKEFEIKEGTTYKIQILNKHGEVVLEDSFETRKIEPFSDEMSNMAQRVAHLDD